MDFLDFLVLSLKCFGLLAWPLLSLCYPLCASIRAIESNSISDIRKLVAYWVIFSLMSLFDHVFMKLLEWIPIWSSLKLMVICWLVLPHFDASLYVYKHFIQPCIFLTPQIIVKQLSSKKDFFRQREDFLVTAERYLRDNGPEALDKLIAFKEKATDDVKEIKAVADKEKAEAVLKEPIDFSSEEIKVEEVTEKKVESTAERVQVNEPEFRPSQNPKRSSPMVDERRATEVGGAAETGATVEKLPEKPAFKQVQKEWTCALCQVTTSCEQNLNMHFLGKSHRARSEELKEAAKNKSSQPSPGKKPEKEKPKMEPKNFEPNPRNQERRKEFQQSTRFFCYVCNVKCPGKVDMDSHLRGKKHLSLIQELAFGKGT